jgi:hypothetical protein
VTHHLARRDTRKYIRKSLNIDLNLGYVYNHELSS